MKARWLFEGDPFRAQRLLDQRKLAWLRLAGVLGWVLLALAPGQYPDPEVRSGFRAANTRSVLEEAGYVRKFVPKPGTNFRTDALAAC